METPPIETVPLLAMQCEALNWRFGYYDFGKAERPGLDFFNSGLVRRPDGLWLLARRADMSVMNGFGLNDVIALKLDETGTIPQYGQKLEWPNTVPGQQFEDARAVWIPHMKQTAVSACTFQWFGEGADPAWSGAIQVLGFFDENWTCKAMHYVPFDTNAPEMRTIPREHYQKNWVWWHRNDKLHLLYKSNPWTVATFGNHWLDGRMVHVGSPLEWGYGEIRGGTPPIEIDGLLVTFFHSSTPWFDRWRRYHMGAIGFLPEPPFTPMTITPVPLLSGTTRDPWGFGKPACIFPCGAIRMEDDRVLITAGVNDYKTCWINARVADILKWMQQIAPHSATAKEGDAKCSANVCVTLPIRVQSTPLSKSAPKSNPEGAEKKRGKRNRRRKQRTKEEQEKINSRMEKVRAAKARA